MIINKWIFYWIDMIDKLSLALYLIFILLGIVGIVAALLSLTSENKDFSDIIKEYTREIKVVTITMIVLAAINIAIPSKETMYQMVIAENITYKNVDKSVKGIKDTVDYIFEKFDKQEELTND